MDKEEMNKPMLGIAYEKFISGLFWGFGLGVSLFVVFVCYDYIEDREFDMFQKDHDFSQYIEIVSHRDISTNNRKKVVAVVKNTYSEEIRYINAEVEFYLKGEFIGECASKIYHVIKQNETDNIDLSCSATEEADWQHDSYTINILRAR